MPPKWETNPHNLDRVQSLLAKELGGIQVICWQHLEKAQAGLSVLAGGSIQLGFSPWESPVHSDGIWPRCYTYKVFYGQVFWRGTKIIHQSRDRPRHHPPRWLWRAGSKSDKSRDQGGPTIEFLYTGDWSTGLLRELARLHYHSQGPDSRSNERLLRGQAQG